MSTNYRDLVELQAANGDEFLQQHLTQGARNAQYTSKFAVTSLIEAIDTWLERNLLLSLTKSPFFYILADEFEVASTKEELSLCCRWVVNGKSEEHFFEILHIQLLPDHRENLWCGTLNCPDTLAQSHRSLAVHSAGRIAAKAEDLKRVKYAELLSSHIFVPIAIETIRVFSIHTLSFMKSLGKRFSRHFGEPKSTSFLIQSLPIAVQRGNAISIRSTFASANLDN